MTDGDGVQVNDHDGCQHGRRPRQHHRLRLRIRTTNKCCRATAITSACSLAANPDDVVRLRRLGNGVSRHVHETSSPGTELHDRSDTTETSGISQSARPVQLRPDQSLPAPRHALQPGRDGPLRARAEFADVYTQLMFTDVRSVAQIAPGGASSTPRPSTATTLSCRRSSWPRSVATPERSPPATRLDSVHWPPQRRGRRTTAGVPQLLLPRPRRIARRVRGRLGLRRQCAVLPHAGGSTHAQLLLTSTDWDGRSTRSSIQRQVNQLAVRQSTEPIRTACLTTPSRSAA